MTADCRIDVLKQLVVDAAKEVAEKAPGEYPHLEKVLKFLLLEQDRNHQIQKMQWEAAVEMSNYTRRIAKEHTKNKPTTIY